MILFNRNYSSKVRTISKIKKRTKIVRFSQNQRLVERKSTYWLGNSTDSRCLFSQIAATIWVAKQKEICKMETFGTRLQRLRKEKGLTQEEVATKLNISAQAVSKWENDLTSPDISVLVELSEILGTTLDELLGKETKKEVEYVPNLEKKDIDKMTLKIVVDSADGDKVRLNLPMAIVRIFVESGIGMPEINGNAALKNIDFKRILELVEQGAVGEFVTVESADGDNIHILVE